MPFCYHLFKEHIVNTYYIYYKKKTIKRSLSGYHSQSRYKKAYEEENRGGKPVKRKPDVTKK